MANRKTKDKFVEEAKNIHGDKYDYSLVAYLSTSKKVEIVCSKHGIFFQSPNKHISGRGCPECGKEKRRMNKRLTKDQILDKFKDVHGDKYYYPDFTPEGVRNNITIICPIHGEFKQEIFSHSQGKGCKQCGIDKISEERRKYNTESFIEHCNVIHNNKYDYSLSEYKSAQTQMIIICPVHGEFSQMTQAHYNGHGCPECGIIERWYIGGFGNKVEYYDSQQIGDEPCYIYLVELEVQGDVCYKVGITSNETPNKRFSSIKHESKADRLKPLFYEQTTLTKAYLIEQYIKNHFYQYRHKPAHRFFGWTECISNLPVKEVITEIKEKLNE